MIEALIITVGAIIITILILDYLKFRYGQDATLSEWKKQVHQIFGEHAREISTINEKLDKINLKSVAEKISGRKI